MSDVQKLTQEMISQFNGRMNSLNQLLADIIRAYYAAQEPAQKFQLFHSYQEAAISKGRGNLGIKTLEDVTGTPEDLKQVQEDLKHDQEALQSLKLPEGSEKMKQQALSETQQLLQTVERIMHPEAGPAEKVETAPKTPKPTPGTQPPR